jgi:hypothetical protein
VEVVISDEARTFVKARGGAVFVRAREYKCCGGALVLLDATSTAPRDVWNFVAYPADEIELYYRGHPRGVPNQLVIELRGLLRRHVAAYKDGCVFPL